MATIDFVKLSQRSLGAVLTIYWVSVVFHPFLYATSFHHLKLDIWLWPFVLVMLSASIALVFRVLITPACLLLTFWMYFVFVTDPAAVDLHWPFLCWLLLAFLLIEHGVDRRRLIELGWLVGGLSLSVHGVAKLLFAGPEWLSGEVVTNFIYASAPRLGLWLNQWNLDHLLGIVGGWFVITFHLIALPHALYRPSRPWFMLSVAIFHGFILISVVYFISIGFIPFWLFLCDGLIEQKRKPAPSN